VRSGLGVSDAAVEADEVHRFAGSNRCWRNRWLLFVASDGAPTIDITLAKRITLHVRSLSCWKAAAAAQFEQSQKKPRIG
jgi:hypothetical protein